MMPLVCLAKSAVQLRSYAKRTLQSQRMALSISLKSINPPTRTTDSVLTRPQNAARRDREERLLLVELVALGLLACLFVIIVYQHRVQTSREWSTAETLAQYEHSLSRANASGGATNRNRGLMEALSALRESALRPGLQL